MKLHRAYVRVRECIPTILICNRIYTVQFDWTWTKTNGSHWNECVQQFSLYNPMQYTTTTCLSWDNLRHHTRSAHAHVHAPFVLKPRLTAKKNACKTFPNSENTSRRTNCIQITGKVWIPLKHLKAPRAKICTNRDPQNVGKPLCSLHSFTYQFLNRRIKIQFVIWQQNFKNPPSNYLQTLETC